MEISKIGADRILEKNIQKTDKANDSQKNQNVREESQVTQSPSQKVKWSEDALLLSKGIEAAKSAPDVRQEKVAALKKAVSEGSYKVDADAVADRMIHESLADSLLTRKG